jgi:para-aminobenzoate N-oxygenase AurF
MAEAAIVTPSPAARTVEALPSTFDVVYTWNYDTVRADLTNLYEKAKREQWNATSQLAWDTDVDPEREIVPDFQIPVYGTHIWERLTEAEIRKLRREALSWTLSQFMHGEQGALLATAQIVDATPLIESKFYAASQVMDEARHVEVYSRYLRDKLSGSYPINRHLRTLLDQILTDGRWDMKYLGMQIMVEGLAMAAFGYMHKMCVEPLLTELTHYVMRDESRHVAFGVLSLNEQFLSLSAAERREREEFLYEGCRLMRDRLLMEDVWEVMGWPVEEVRGIVLASPQMQEFRKMLFAKIVPNVKRLGLLTPWVRERFAELGILQFEHEEPSA